HAWLKIHAWIYPISEIETGSLLVVHFDRKGGPYWYRTVDLRNFSLKPGQWNEVTYLYFTPNVRKKTDRLAIYAWLMGGRGKFLIDDIQVEVYESKFQPSLF
ncbi:MAG: hypothetical protein ACUVRD_01805, partial [Bacteroidia bacterium]